MRQYQPIWNAIKATGKCTLVCNAEGVARIQKAVIKEKYSDPDVKWKLRRLSVMRADKDNGQVELEFKLYLKLSAF